MAFFDSSSQVGPQRIGLQSNHTQPIPLFRHYQWKPWRLRQADALYRYRARIEPKSINTLLSLDGSQSGKSVLRPGMPSRSMESGRNKDAPVKDTAPVKETALVIRRPNGKVNKQESATGMFSLTSALTTQAIPINPRPQSRQTNESTHPQNPYFPYPNPRNVFGLSAFKLRIIELTCLERDTIRSEEARMRLFGNCRSTVGVKPSINLGNRQSNTSSYALQRGRPKSASSHRPSCTNNVATRPRSATTTRSIKQMSSSSTTELIIKPTTLLPTRSKSCLDMTDCITQTGPPGGVKECDQKSNKESSIASIKHHTSRDVLDLPKPVSHSLGVLEEFLEGRSTDSEDTLEESSTTSESDTALFCKEQHPPHKSNQEEDIHVHVLECSALNTPCEEEPQTCHGSATPILPSTETSTTNRDAICSQKQPKTKDKGRQQKTSSENGSRKSKECTHSKSETYLTSKSVAHSKTFSKSKKESKLKRHHRRIT